MRYEPHILGAISGYEFVALVAHSPKVPTITALIGRLPKFARRMVACAAGVYLWDHFGG